MSQVSIRQARTFLAACKHSSISGAAQAINRSQTSVTKSLQKLERDIGVELFDRSSKGVTLTAFGKALEVGAAQAAQALSAAGEMVPPLIMQGSPGVLRFFQMDVSDKWLDAFLATAEHQNLSVAAEHLGVTTAAVSSNIRKLEDTLNASLFERLPSANIPTSFARELVRYIKLAKSHLRQSVDEIASMQGEEAGSVSIGSLPFVRTLILPRAISWLRRDHPNIDISTMEGRYDDLVTALRCGDIDFLVGALRGTVIEAGLQEEPIMDDQLSIIVRVGHPLQKKKRLTWPMLMAYEWILPRIGTPTRSLFENALHQHGLGSPQHVVETSSMILLRGLLLEGDQVTVLSRHQVFREVESGMLATLPFTLPTTIRPIGITSRAKGGMSPAARLLTDNVRKVAATLK